PRRRILPGDVHALSGRAALAVAAGCAVGAGGVGALVAVGAGAHVDWSQDLRKVEQGVLETQVVQRRWRNARGQPEIVPFLVALAQAGEVDAVHELLVVDDDAGRGIPGHDARSSLALFPASGEARAIGVSIGSAAHSLGPDHPVEGSLGV